MYFVHGPPVFSILGHVCDGGGGGPGGRVPQHDAGTCSPYAAARSCGGGGGGGSARSASAFTVLIARCCASSSRSLGPGESGMHFENERSPLTLVRTRGTSVLLKPNGYICALPRCVFQIPSPYIFEKVDARASFRLSSSAQLQLFIFCGRRTILLLQLPQTKPLPGAQAVACAGRRRRRLRPPLQQSSPAPTWPRARARRRQRRTM